MEWLKEVRAIVDLGVTAIWVLGLFVVILRPPKWIQTVVAAHHTLAQGVATMSEVIKEIPRREDVQEILIGQEALRRETAETRNEVRELSREVADGRRG